ncbi:hypothetical protein LguiB_024150 [Lonicera macranthoides]
MGKASKWIMNFLVGKKEETNKKKDASFSSESIVISTTPKVKRRWSFGRSTGTENPRHKSTMSFDSFVTRQLVTKALLEGKFYEQNQCKAMVVATNKAAVAKTRALEYAAAIRIQAVFRSYLARKALCALRGLVKIQALVRGHLVRKQTTSMLRSMNALMAIQLRARVHRIQKSEESQSQLLIERRTSHSEARNYSKSKSVHKHVTNPETERTEHGFIRHHSSSLSVSKQEHQFSLYTGMSSRTYDTHFDAFLYNAAQKSPQNYPTGPNCRTEKTGYEDGPSYMANTESSRAKVRSQSEPKRRPVTQKSRRTASSDMRTVTPGNQTRVSSPVLRDNSTKTRHPWLIKLYRSSKSVKEIECDSRSTGTTEDSYCRALIAYENLLLVSSHSWNAVDFNKSRSWREPGGRKNPRG